MDILRDQIKRGGWWDTALRSTLAREHRPWFLSCYLARECALAGNWTGQGLSDSKNSRYNPMREACIAELRLFTDRISATEDRRSPTTRVCTTSTCGRFLITACGLDIYTHGIEGCSLRLLSKISCEKQVLAVTIDATSEKFVVAALLEGRIGLYVDMNGVSRPAVSNDQWESASALNNTSATHAPVMDFGEGDKPRSREVLVGEFDELSVNAASFGEATFLHQSVDIVTQRSLAQYFHAGRARLRGTRRLPRSDNGVWPGALNFDQRGGEKQSQAKALPQIVYRNICFDEDPAISIAISPTRQCVAFGCKAGVELYWIDPSTGQNLNRYFPLSKPSDHLYFLPPRRHIDSALRLRLIGSPVYSLSTDEYEKHPVQNPQTSFWFTLSGPWHFPIARAARQQARDTDHSHAIPLSDGHHILFTDNATGLLCLGSDRPVGSLQRLSRKFVFEPPAVLNEFESLGLPQSYAAANSLDRGARIVGAYGSAIVLYSIPVDALRYSTAEQEGTIRDSSKPFEELKSLHVLCHPTSNAQAVQENTSDRLNTFRCDRLNMLWAHFLPGFANHGPTSLDTLWPLRVEGTVIGSLDGVSALSVQETDLDGLVVWAFGAGGIAKAWDVDSGQRPFEKAYFTVMPEGTIVHEV